jgi:dCMP deaminase
MYHYTNFIDDTQIIEEQNELSHNNNINTKLISQYSQTNRPSWDEYFKNIVQVASTRSPCKRLQVGCLIVKDNRIISQGYNGFLPGCPHKSIIRDDHEQATIHAEQNAICDCAKRGVSCENSIAYSTHYPCIICMRILCASGIRHIKYINNYKNDPLVEQFSLLSKVKISQI